ncbi:MAG: hypothetical protein ACTTK1_07645 [Candidatus Cryptobacteroides sp.]
MFKKIRGKIVRFKLSMRMKLTLSLLAIAVILMISSVIAILEYSRMSNYVSELIAENINSINVAQKIADETNTYNLNILAIIGSGDGKGLPAFDQNGFMSHCDSLRAALAMNNLAHLADSVEYSYSAYMLTSLELPDVIKSDFIDTRSWYFDRLQPVYNGLKRHIDELSTAIYKLLQKNSATFERGFYRSIIPGAVAVAVGILLVLLLLFMILAYYVNPIYKMLAGLQNYQAVGKKYNYSFEGDDELVELNEGITEIIEENLQLRKRVRSMREMMSQHEPQNNDVK